MSTGFYGEAPADLGPFTPKWDEFMHYLYLPVRIPQRDREFPGGLTGLPEQVRQPGGHWFRPTERLWFLLDAIGAVLDDAHQFPHLRDPYVYVTARRGFVSPGNPGNRPGWHCDDFGGHDLNYIWSDAYPTRLLMADYPLNIPDDDAESMVAMERYADSASRAIFPNRRVVDAPAGHLLRLTPYVIHNTPEVDKPGMRSFFKISVSNHRYDLVGNSHNYLLDYDWPMFSREELRNQPTGGNRDYSGVTA